jgi:hypothetical protein
MTKRPKAGRTKKGSDPINRARTEKGSDPINGARTIKGSDPIKHARTRMGSDPISRTLVFVGPTMSADDVRQLLPAAEVRGPAAVGDVLRAAHERGVGRIAIIDGYFERMAAVWHKEILVAMERGIEVWGAASMGALRAAELAAFGMRGVGEVYRLYKSGAVTADDEVAVAHMPAKYGYEAASVALVNIRVNLLAAQRARIVSARTAGVMFEMASKRFYRDRAWSTLFEDSRAARLPVKEVAAFEAAPKIDQKAQDARLLLGRLRRASKQPRRKIAVPRTWALRQLERLML